MAKNKPINLLPQEEFDASIFGRVLKWAMGSFRIIVIVTEMTVMAAFLSRFWLDAQNSDLNDTLQVKQAQISTQSDFEKKFRAVQSKLSIFKSLASAQEPTDKISIITNAIPQEVTLAGLSVQESSAEIKGNSGSEFGIAQFMSNLQSVKAIKSVDLIGFGTSESNSGANTFTIDITF